jgi:hypothetical protein
MGFKLPGVDRVGGDVWLGGVARPEVGVSLSEEESSSHTECPVARLLGAELCLLLVQPPLGSVPQRRLDLVLELQPPAVARLAQLRRRPLVHKVAECAQAGPRVVRNPLSPTVQFACYQLWRLIHHRTSSHRLKKAEYAVYTFYVPIRGCGRILVTRICLQ